VGNHLRIGVRAKRHPFGLQFFPQAAVVLDDAVLHHGHPRGTIKMRMGIALFRLAVGGPAGVTNAALTSGTNRFKAGGEVHQLALGAQAAQITCSINGGNAGGVVTAVLQLTQPFQKQRRCFARTDYRNDAAHGAGNNKKARASRALSL